LYTRRQRSLFQMEKPVSLQQLEEPVGGACLAAIMADGILPLATALGYATEVAATLRELHAEGRGHGEVGPDHVHVGTRGAVLLPPRAQSRRADQYSDVVAFGALLYELMTGSEPPQDLSTVATPLRPRLGPQGVRTAATRLALRCLGAASDAAPHIQQALTEVRLYSLLAGQSDWQFAAEEGRPKVDDSPPIVQDGESLRAAAEMGAPSANQPCALAPPAPSLESSTDLKRYLVPPEQVPPPLPPSDIKCPNCGSLSVFRSRPRGFFERLLERTGMRLYRCHRCPYRYVWVFKVACTKGAPFF